MVSTRTLRFYDETGLLKPERQDLSTGYRYYSVSQLSRLNRILVLKDMGLSLDQIKQLVDSDITPEQIRGMLKLKQVELHQQISEGYNQLARIETWLEQIDNNNLNLEYQVIVRKIEQVRVAAIKTTISDLSGINLLFEELAGYLAEHRVNPAGPPQALFYDEEYRETNLEVEAVIPVEGTLPQNERIKVRVLPVLETAATLVHTGPWEKLIRAFTALLGWIETNNYQISGPNREIFIKAAPPGDSANFVTEVLFPVIKR